MEMYASIFLLAVAIVGMVLVVRWSLAGRAKSESASADIMRYLAETEGRNELAAMKELREAFTRQSQQMAVMTETLLDRALVIGDAEIEMKKAEAERAPVRPMQVPKPSQNGTYQRRVSDVDVLMDALENGDGL